MRRLTALLLALALAFALAACGAPAAGGAQTPAPTPASDPTEAPTPAPTKAPEPDPDVITYPVTVTDQLGRDVVIEAQPEKLVSGYYISTSLLIALGLEEKLVGVEAKAASRTIYQLSAPQIIDLPSVGTAKEFDLEGCAALEPDLVILPAKLKDVIPSLEELGIAVIAVDPEDEALLEEAVAILGQATNTVERAQALLAFHDEQLSALTKDLTGLEAPTVYLASNSALLSCAGPEMYQNSLIEQAGGVNVAAEITDDYWAEVSYEQILAWDPEYIILAADAEYGTEAVLSDENLQGCRAVKNCNVYQFPSTIEAWDSPVPSAILGSMWLAEILHRDDYPAENWAAAVNGYYQTFYDFDPMVDVHLGIDG